MINRMDERNQVGLKAAGEGDEESEREMASSRVDPSNISEEDEDEGPALKVRKGRPEPRGDEATAEGSIVGSGRGGEPAYKNTMGHVGSGGREPKARHTLGDHDGESEGEGFEAGGNLRKEHGRIRNEP